MIKIFGVIVLIGILFIFLLVIEAYIARQGKKEDFRNPERISNTYGSGDKKINYLVIGDSTSAGQGADYKDGIAIGTTNELSKTHSVTMTNLSISGATTGDIVKDQLPLVATLNPDVVLISIGANDVTQIVSTSKIKANLEQIISTILKTNCNAKIILTASPDMGAAPRLAQPLRYIAGLQAFRINKVFDEVILSHNLTLAPIAKETGPIFRKDSSLFAADRYHPNARGYAIWIPILNNAIATALQNQPSHCSNN